MREILNSNVVGNIELDAQKKIRSEINKRWEDLGFCEGLEGHMKENIATLYENEAKMLLREATDASNSGSFETVVFPIVRRIFSKLLANDIVSVQALNLPIGKLFFIKPVTSERQWDFQNPGELTDGDTGSHVGLMGYTRYNKNKNGQPENRYYLPDEVINEVGGEMPEVTQYFKKTLYDLFYNDFLFDNSKGKVTIKVGSATPVLLRADGAMEVTDFNTYPISNIDSSMRRVMLQISGFNSYNAGRLTGPDGNEMDTEEFLASLKVISLVDIQDPDNSGFTTFKAGESIPFRLVSQKYGAAIVEYEDICSADGKLYIELDFKKPIKDQGQTIDGYIGANPKAFASFTQDLSAIFKVAWAQYDSLELETEIGEVSFQLDSVVVSVTERKLRATWSPELAQDVSAFHNIDAEAELTAILSEQIAAEVDREILRDLRKSAPWQLRWDYNGWKRQAGFSTNYTQKDWNQTFVTKVNQISAQIQKATLRGGANWIVISTEISAMLNDLEYFHVTDASAESDQYNMGIERIGSLGGRYQVIVDPYSPHWSCIIGHHGKSLLDTGYIYAPYVPLSLTNTMYNPFNMAPIKGIITRYAKKMVNNRYFGHIRVDGLTTWSPNELR